MYNNYTPLQQHQLALQEYSNTQSTYLLVCASARSTALKATLTDQLHRKFRLVERLDGELTASVDGVLLAAEDVELMSTALMFFAKALQDGADYAVCNAVFGFGGATALYQSGGFHSGNILCGEFAFSALAAEPLHGLCHHGSCVVIRQPVHLRALRHGENERADHGAVDKIHFETVGFFKLRQTSNDLPVLRLCLFRDADCRQRKPKSGACYVSLKGI